MPSSAGWPAPPPAPTPFWRRIPIRLVIIAVILVAGSIGGWYLNASRSSSGEITKGGDLTSNDLRVGDCWDLKDPTAEVVQDVTARPCTDEHEYEVFYVGTMPGGDTYPAGDAFQTFVTDNCDPAFAAYVGKSYGDSVLEVLSFYPAEDGWTTGDRTVECSVYHPRVHRLTESLKGSNE